ncbi:MAG: pyridoxamine 5'-phosphate oxidase family protein [Coprobacillaceae bacterium]
MNTKKEFITIMKGQTDMALATTINNQPNVRIVNFYYHQDNNIIYFVSLKDNDKVTELRNNNQVAFTTIPHYGSRHVKGQAVVKESKLSIFDIKDDFIKQVPDIKDVFDNAATDLILFEIAFDEVIVTIDFTNINILNFRE